MHDLLIMAGVYSLTGREVTASTVAALLTILGYSLYDTIIVFDRVRENVPRMPQAAFSQIVNRSMSEVLNRSLATSFCTLLPMLALLLFGGDTLKDFAFALIVGIASGAYSSIFIASPVLTHWKERERTFALRRVRILGEHGGVMPAYADGAGRRARAQEEAVALAVLARARAGLGRRVRGDEARARHRGGARPAPRPPPRAEARQAGGTGAATTERPPTRRGPSGGEDGGDGDDSKPKRTRQRNKRHGRPR